MELRIPSVEQLRTIYDRDLKEAFPTAELKPLRNIEKSWAEGWYKPYCLFDGDNIVGEAFLWLGPVSYTHLHQGHDPGDLPGAVRLRPHPHDRPEGPDAVSYTHLPQLDGKTPWSFTAV